MKVIHPKQGGNPGSQDSRKRVGIPETTAAQPGSSKISGNNQQRRPPSSSGGHATSAYAPGDAIDALDPAVSSQLTTILVTEALKNASTKNVPFHQLPSSDVTLRSDDKFSPYAAVNASSCAVTAPKVTELHRSVTPWGVSHCKHWAIATNLNMAP